MVSLQSIVDSSNSEFNHKKRRKIDKPAKDPNSLSMVPWRSETEQRIYSSKLLEALRHVLRRRSTTTSKPGAAREVRETADRVLAATAKGRTRWSRAILAAPLSRWKFQTPHKKARKVVNQLKTLEIRRNLPAVQKKAHVLSRLVPGCRKISFPNLLEEATDYITALEMQVRAMTTLTELLAGSASAGGLGSTLP